MEKYCSICRKKIDSEKANIFTVAGFGTPRYICDECDTDFEVATLGKDTEAISSAMDNIGRKIALAEVEDEVIIKTVGEILDDARERAEMISSGIYDFSRDEEEQIDEDEEIPLDLQETDEDIALDKVEAEKMRKYDKITNIAVIVLIALALGFAAYKIITMLL